LDQQTKEVMRNYQSEAKMKMQQLPSCVQKFISESYIHVQVAKAQAEAEKVGRKFSVLTWRH